MTVVLSAFLAETQTAHDRKRAVWMESTASFLATVWKNQGGRELIWLGSCALARLCFVYNDHKITSCLKRRVK